MSVSFPSFRAVTLVNILEQPCNYYLSSMFTRVCWLLKRKCVAIIVCYRDTKKIGCFTVYGKITWSTFSLCYSIRKLMKFMNTPGALKHDFSKIWWIKHLVFIYKIIQTNSTISPAMDSKCLNKISKWVMRFLNFLFKYVLNRLRREFC